MSEKDKQIAEAMTKAIEGLSDEQKDRILWLAEGAAMMAAAKNAAPQAEDGGGREEN